MEPSYTIVTPQQLLGIEWMQVTIILWMKVGFGISRTNADSQWNPVYNTFHRIFLLWKRNESSFNVILMRQTCGQRSSRAAESKRRALGNYFSERICYMFLMSKCRGDWDLGLCTFWVLAKREALRNAKFWFFCGRNTFFFWSRHCAGVLFSQVPKKCTDLDFSLIYILTLQIKSEKYFPCARRLLSAALLERWPQVCYVKITFTKLPTNRFVCTTKNRWNAL